MTQKLHEVFHCESKEALYAKLKQGDASVRALQDFVNYTKVARMLPQTTPLKGPMDVGDYYACMEPLNDKEACLLFVNIKNCPMHITTFMPDNKRDVQRALREGIMAGSANSFLLVDSAANRGDVAHVEKMLNQVNIEMIDKLTYQLRRNTLTTSKGNMTFDINPIPMSNHEVVDLYEPLQELEGFNDFASYYAEKELLGLDMLANNEEIQACLKFAYQHQLREIGGVLIYDKHNTVIAVQELFKGGINATVVDTRVIAREVLQKDGKGLAFFHNHPSGRTTSSPEDIKFTEFLKGMCDTLDIEFIDHYIVGKEQVYSFAKEEPTFASSQQNYQAAMKGYATSAQVVDLTK